MDPIRPSVRPRTVGAYCARGGNIMSNNIFRKTVYRVESAMWRVVVDDEGMSTAEYSIVRY